jgi:predicted nucleotidyltransferase
MAGKILNTEKLQPEVRKKFVPYLEKMLDMYGENLISVIVYGSAASGGYIKGVSDINSAFIFKDLTFPLLKKGLKNISRGISGSIAAPLFLTREYIYSSLDVFPIEFMDMKEKHVLVNGEDIISALDIKGEHIRLFCEQQVKGKLVRIRQAYLEVGLSKKGMIYLMTEALNSLVPVFRNLIRIKGGNPPLEKAAIIEALSGIFGLDPGVFLQVYRESTREEKITSAEVETLIDSFMSEVEKLSVMVDEL